MSRFDILETPIEGLQVLQRKPIGDHRGFLERLFCDTELSGLMQGKLIRQVNHTLTQLQGTVRGMHFQYPPYSEKKLVSCLRGKVFDVAIDLRKASPTFLQWHAEILGEDNMKTLLIPEGFAHGFQALGDDCEMLYFHTDVYQADYESGLDACDPSLAIEWPLAITERSERDIHHAGLTDGFKGISL